MNRNRKLKKTAAATMAVAMAATVGVTSFPMSALAADNTVEKEETVYVNADAEGKTEEVIVSDWLKTAGLESKIDDVTSLLDIENVKGDETFEQKKGSVVWNADGSDIYYQGTTKEELPVSVSIAYKLDGKSISPEELAGKSGKVEMKFTYKNTSKQSVKVGESNKEVFTPFAMITGMLLPTETFSNVTIDNGKILSDGSKTIAVGIAMPGLQESLKLADNEKINLDIPETVTITADVKEFESSSTLTLATTDFFQDLELDDVDSMDELEDSLSELGDASQKLVDGTKELSDGTVTLSDGTSQFKEGTDTLNSGSTELVDGLNTLNNSKGTLISGINQIVQAMGQLESGAGALNVGVAQYVNGTGTLATGVQQYTAGTSQLEIGLNQLNSQTTTLPAQLQALNDGVSQLKAGADALADSDAGAVASITSALTQVQTGLTAASSYVEALSSGLTNLQGASVVAQTNATDTVTELSGEIATYNSLIQQLQGMITPAQTESSSSSAEVSRETSEPTVIDSTTTQETNDLGQDVVENEDGTTTITNNIETVITNTITKEQTTTVTNQDTVTSNTVASTEELQAICDNMTSNCGQMNATLQKAMTTKGYVDAVVSGTAQLQGAISGDGSSENPGLSAVIANTLSGVNQLMAAMNTDSESSTSLKTNLESLSSGMSSLSENCTTFAGMGSQLAAGVEQLKNGADTLTANNDSLNTGAQQLIENGSSLVSGASTLASGATQLKEGGTTLSAGSDTLSSAIQQLADGGNTLKSGINTLAEKSSELNDGAKKLNDGAIELNDGMVKFDKEGIKKLTDAFDGDIQDLIDRLKAIKDAGTYYNTFSGLSDKMDGTVKFIIETKGIENSEE